MEILYNNKNLPSVVAAGIKGYYEKYSNGKAVVYVNSENFRSDALCMSEKQEEFYGKYLLLPTVKVLIKATEDYCRYELTEGLRWPIDFISITEWDPYSVEKILSDPVQTKRTALCVGCTVRRYMKSLTRDVVPFYIKGVRIYGVNSTFMPNRTLIYLREKYPEENVAVYFMEPSGSIKVSLLGPDREAIARSCGGKSNRFISRFVTSKGFDSCSKMEV